VLWSSELHLDHATLERWAIYVGPLLYNQKCLVNFLAQEVLLQNIDVVDIINFKTFSNLKSSLQSQIETCWMPWFASFLHLVPGLEIVIVCFKIESDVMSFVVLSK
jgi:hypothetical protein